LGARDYSRLASTAFARERVAGLTLLVVGAGALGNEVIKNLALLRVGRSYCQMLWIGLESGGALLRRFR
jgi:molybdopterin/thiamine biosynthesis adenylyltransferase